MIREITSRDNAVYKQLKQLNKASESRKQGLILVEGFRQVQEALQAGLTIKHAIITAAAREGDGWERLKLWHSLICDESDCLLMMDGLFRQISGTNNPQGIALICNAPVVKDPQIIPTEKGLYLILEEIQDPGNLGSMIRSADAFGFDAVLLTSGCVWPYFDKALRAAMGSSFHLPVYEFTDVAAAATWLKQTKTSILAADPTGTDLPLLREGNRITRPAAVVIGNEGRGLTPQARSLADYLVRIPMPGQAESLNAAAAAAILCYELSCIS